MVGARVLCRHLGKFFVQEGDSLVHCLLVQTYMTCALYTSFSFVASDPSEED